MKGEIAEYVSGCDTCQRVKASHLKTAGQMQPLSIPAWKWDDISMDFIVRLPLTSRKHDSIWVIVDPAYQDRSLHSRSHYLFS
jgi:hypothetical protein